MQKEIERRLEKGRQGEGKKGEEEEGKGRRERRREGEEGWEKMKKGEIYARQVEKAAAYKSQGYFIMLVPSKHLYSSPQTKEKALQSSHQ